MGTKTVLKTENFAFFDNSCFMIDEHHKACITAQLSQLDEQFFTLPFLPLISYKYNPKTLELLTYFSDTPITCNEQTRVSRMMKYFLSQ